MYARNSDRVSSAALRLDADDLRAALLDALTRQGVQFKGEVTLHVIGDGSPEDGEAELRVAPGGEVRVGALVFS